MSSRVQVALNVRDVESATKFYSRLFRTEPHKVRDGYANFAIADPPLKVVLLEHPDPDEALNHLGVELADSEAVVTATRTFEELGLQTRVSRQEACCHAVQDKVYVMAPEVPIGMWEFYSVLDDDPAEDMKTDSGCCASGAEDIGNAIGRGACGTSSPVGAVDDAPCCG